MFIGRKIELELIKKEFQKKSSSILIYGKRKIGKTTLVREACKDIKNKIVIYYECIKDTLENNIQKIIELLKKNNIMSATTTLTNLTFIDLFDYLNELNTEIILIIDEYPYLKEFTNSKTLDSIFQDLIDNHLKNINLVLLGSHMAMMLELLEEKNALFGRFNLHLLIAELKYYEAQEFYNNKTPYDKVAFYSVFGGSPFVNSFISPNLDLKENIVNILLNQNSPVYIYMYNLLLSDLSNSLQISRLLSVLKNGKKSYSELENQLDKNKTGLLSKIIKPALEMFLIKKTSPINKLNDPKKSKYELNDNLMCFYYTFIFPVNYLLNTKDANLLYDDEILPSINTFISYRFEDICRDFLWNYISLKQIKNITNIGTYYYDDIENKINGEFDIAILKKNNHIYIYEVKYLKSKVDEKTIHKEKEQINRIKEINVDNIGFISINGFEDNLKKDIDFDGNDIYKNI